MGEINQEISEFIREFSKVPSSDLLFNVQKNEQKLIFFDSKLPEKISLDPKLTSILKTSNAFEKETDVNTLSLVKKVIHWKIKDQWIQTPLGFYNLNFQVQKITNTVFFQADELFKPNPIFERIFYENFPHANLIDLSEAENTANELILLFQTLSLPFEIINTTLVGNFNYFRFEILRELEGIKQAENYKNTAISNIFGEQYTTNASLNLTNQTVMTLDNDQLLAVDQINLSDLVVIGPPGTGKTQVITQVLANLLNSNKKGLLVSEKRVALEVIEKKLGSLGLGKFAFLIHSQTKSKDLLHRLAQSWKDINYQSYSEEKNLYISKNIADQLQLRLDRLNSETYFSGVNYKTFKELEKKYKEISILDPKPTSINFARMLELEKILHPLINQQVKGTDFEGINIRFFQEQKPLEFIEEIEQKLTHFKSFNVHSFADFQALKYKLVQCFLIDNPLFNVFFKLLQSEKKWAKFEKLRVQINQYIEENKHLTRELTIWKSIPTHTELISWKKNQNLKKSFFSKDLLEPKLINSTIDLELATQILDKYYENQQKISDAKIALFNLGVLFTDISDLEVSYAYSVQLKKQSLQDVNHVLLWSSNERKKLLDSWSDIHHLQTTISPYFDFENTQNFEKIFLKIKEIYNKLNNKFEIFNLIKNNEYYYIQSFPNLSDSIVHIYYYNHLNYNNLNSTILDDPTLHYTNLLRQFKIQEKKEFKLIISDIIHRQNDKLAALEHLLQQNPKKLNLEQKEHQQILKKGKRILVKEMSKTRAHMPIRALLNCDAKHWIEAFFPLWLSNPNQIANHFPLLPKLFDLVLFDEASQIPLPHALGSLYRSKHCFVAGDDQQMSPTSFFGQNYQGSDLLHQALFYLKSTHLNHHYRSENQSLIEFSNRHFYKNQLQVFPTPSKGQALFSHFCQTGKFVDRKNIEEAEKMIALISKHDLSKSIGIVAFSEQQLQLIHSLFTTEIKEKLELLEQENKFFMKSLENVQGDEADVLYISMAYAKNEEGNFHLRFGPLNQVNGHKRLNVLLTRAKTTIHFIHSVGSTDFPLSQNTGVNLLATWLRFLENSLENSGSWCFPLGITNISNKLIVSNPHEIKPLAKDFIYYFDLFSSRGWELNFT